MGSVLAAGAPPKLKPKPAPVLDVAPFRALPKPPKPPAGGDLTAGVAEPKMEVPSGAAEEVEAVEVAGVVPKPSPPKPRPPVSPRS